MELQTFLNDRDFPAAVDFALKLWNSIEYVHISKYEIILEYVSANLSKFVKHICKNGLNSQVEFTGVLRLLTLPYPMIAVKSATQQNLVDSLLVELKKTTEAPQPPLIEAILTVLMHQNMKTYFKDNLEAYGRSLAAFFGYYTEHLRTNAATVDRNYVRAHVDTVFQSLNNYIKVIDMLPGNFKHVFYTSIMSHLCEFVVHAKSTGFNFYQSYLTMLRSLFFKDDNQKLFTEFFEKGAVKSQPDWINLFDCVQQPAHIVLVTIEAFLMAYSSVNVPCVKFLCKHVFTLAVEANVQEQLLGLNHFVGLLVKYDVKIVDANGFGELIVGIVRRHHLRYPAETMDICVGVIHFNKYLLEGQIFEFITAFMFLKKSSDREFEMYARFLRTVLNVMFETESAGQFVSHLLETVKSRLAELKLSKKLKRKSRKVDAEEDAPKKRKTEDGEASGVEGYVTPAISEQLKLVLLPQQEEQVAGYTLKDNAWSDITFAWPHANVGRAFMLLCDKFRPTTVGHPIVNLLVDGLREDLSAMSFIDGASENQLFLVDFLACLLSEFFAGSRIAEKAVKSRNQIANIHDQVHGLLREFGNRLLSLEHNLRLMNAFLNLSYNFGNWEILLLHYLPDTYTTKPAAESQADADRPNIDVAQRWRQLYSYLSADEWSTLEQRIINFGRDECKVAMNRLSLQKMRANVLFSGTAGPFTSSLMLASFSEFAQIFPVLEDPCTNLWFIGQLERQQKTTVADLILAAAEKPDIVRNFLENREFFEVLLVSIYELAADQFHGKVSLLKTVDFGRANQFHEDVVQQLTGAVAQHNPKVMKKYAKDEICKLLDLLASLPLEYLEDSVKAFAFGLNLALFVDCAATRDEELALKAYNVFLKLLYNKLPQDLSRTYKLDLLLTVLPDLVKYQQFYDFYAFNSCKCFNAQTQKNFEAVAVALEGDQANENLLLLGLVLVQKMSQMTSAQLKQEEVAALLRRLVLLGAKAMTSVGKPPSEYLEKTFAGFLSILRYSLVHKEDDTLLGQVKPLLQHFIDHSIQSSSASSKVLLNIFVKSPDHVKLLDIGESTLNAYLAAEWSRFEQEAVASVTLGTDAPIKYTDIDVTHLVVLNKTELELKELLKAVVLKFNKKQIEDNNFLILLKIFERLINLASRLDISPEKVGTIMSYCQTVIQDHLSALYVGKSEENLATLIRILHCYSNSTKRQRIIVYQGNVDTILDVLLHVNIKKLTVTEANRAQVFEIHDLMSEIVFNLVKKREKVIMNRIPQLLEVYKDLCRVICGYKADQTQLQLDGDEVMVLAQLSHKLEKLTEHIISMGDIVKLVAPATLTHLIRIMITNKKSATLPDKIKKIFRNICYLWIKISNESAGHLITRMCRDDVKNIYTKLCKEYEMYVKFKGKI